MFLFGVVTVVSVLQESTDRKRGTIGILRVMGVSRVGVFYLVVLRAGAIGLSAIVLARFCSSRMGLFCLAGMPVQDGSGYSATISFLEMKS